MESGQRHPFIVISIPGFNDWAQHLEDKQNHLKHLEQQPNSSKRLSLDSGLKLKRSYDECNDDEEAMEVVENAEVKKEARKSENNETIDNTTNIVSKEHLLNFPLPNVESKSCLVMVSICCIYKNYVQKHFKDTLK